MKLNAAVEFDNILSSCFSIKLKQLFWIWFMESYLNLYNSIKQFKTLISNHSCDDDRLEMAHYDHSLI